MTACKERLRFTIHDDLCLLRQVLCYNPYEDTQRWTRVREDVAIATSKNFTLRAIKEHLEYLLLLWAREDRANIRKSGTEEEYSEKEQLLQEVTDLVKEFRGRKVPGKLVKGLVKGKSEARSREVGVVVRDAAACAFISVVNNLEEETHSMTENVQPEVQPFDDNYHVEDSQSAPSPSLSTSSAISGPIRHRRTRVNMVKNSSLQFLQEKHKMERELKEKEVEIERRKVACEEKRLVLQEQQLQLERDKFELDKKEREHRWAQEMEERQHRLATEKQQHDLIKLLIHQQHSK